VSFVERAAPSLSLIVKASWKLLAGGMEFQSGNTIDCSVVPSRRSFQQAATRSVLVNIRYAFGAVSDSLLDPKERVSLRLSAVRATREPWRVSDDAELPFNNV
jgi:hypothetical protein